MNRTNIALITIDALRYDTAISARTPYIHGLMKEYQTAGSTGWVKVGAHGTYTLPAHVSMFQAGILPSMNIPQYDAPYNRQRTKLFRAQLSWTRNNKALYPTPEAPNIVKGFAKLGYRTLGIGGVHWFDTRYETSKNLWNQYFDEFYWEEEYAEENPEGFERQIDRTRELLTPSDARPLFYFLNVSTTHFPYQGHEKSVAGQIKCLEYIDKHLPTLIELLPRPLHLILMADHGECFGEDGLWEHSCYHPMVMEVPMVSLELS